MKMMEDQVGNPTAAREPQASGEALTRWTIFVKLWFYIYS